MLQALNLGSDCRTFLYATLVLLSCVINTSVALAVEPIKIHSIESKLLKQAQSFIASDPQESEKLAKEVLRLQKNKEYDHVSAQAHMLLGELSLQTQNIDASKKHFLDASVIYKNLNDTQEQVLSSIEYAKLFFDEKMYEDGFNIIDEILPLAYQRGEDQLISAALSTKAHAHYDQKDYKEAIVIFENTLMHLTGDDANTQTQLGLTYHQIGQAYKQLQDYGKSVLFHKKALEVFALLQDQKLIARAFKNVAIIESKRGNDLIAVNFYNRSLEIYRQIEDPEQHAEVTMLIGVIYRDLGRYEKSLEYTFKAHLMFQEIGDIVKIADTSNQIGHLYTKLKKYEQARSFYQLSIDLPENKTNNNAIGSALIAIAKIDLNSGQYDTALQSAQKAYSIYKKDNNGSRRSFASRIIGQIYQAKGEKLKAIEYFRKTLSLAQESGDEVDRIKALSTLGRALMGSNVDEAYILLRKSLVLAEQENVLWEKVSVYKALRKIVKARGDFTEALRLAEAEISLSQAFNKESEKNKLARAKAMLDSHKTDLELEVLRKKIELDKLEFTKKNNEIEIVKQSRRISELELAKNRYASIMLAALLLVCLSVAIYIYHRFITTTQRNKELDYLAARDPLTNCYNRRILFDVMNRDFVNIDQLEEYCIVMADIDQFKNINDTHGHNVGDDVIRNVAKILEGCVKANDVVARYGGEEFCIVFPSSGLEHAKYISENMRKKIEASCFGDIMITCSFGISSINFGAKSPEKLLDQADAALYRSKASGRNQISIWDSRLEKNDENIAVSINVG